MCQQRPLTVLQPKLLRIRIVRPGLTVDRTIASAPRISPPQTQSFCYIEEEVLDGFTQ